MPLNSDGQTQATSEAVLLLAGGQGARMASDRPKQFLTFGGKTILHLATARLRQALPDAAIIVVVPEGYVSDAQADLSGFRVQIVPGGSTRTASMLAGLKVIDPASTETIYIHDAARPLVSQDLINRLREALKLAPGAAPALPVADTVRRGASDGDMFEDVDRSHLHRIQTPQAFRLPAFLNAIAALGPDAEFSDDLALLRAAGLGYRLVPGDERLFKITYPADLERLAMTLPQWPRTGTGFDAHRLGPGDGVWLCGQFIPHNAALIGHSDADVAWHALTDALLGALCAGDIGAHFPPSDPQWKGAPSRVFLAHAATLVGKSGGQISHVDLTIICEAPKVGPHREQLRQNTAEVLGVPVTRVSVKATTTEAMGFTGRREGIAALASATILLPDQV